MDIQDLSTSLKVLNHNGACFNVQEKFQIEMALNHLLNSSAPSDYDELLFWGRVSGIKADYFIAMGVCYSDRFEFPEKKFYWCSPANDMVFQPFPELNSQHKNELDKFANKLFVGSPADILISVEKTDEQAEAEKQAREAAQAERTSLDSTEEEDPESLIVRVNLKEIDRLHYHVRSIETECHIIPQGCMKLTVKHEVHRNEAFSGLNEKECFDLQYYSHFRTVQDAHKRETLETDDAIFSRDFLDDVHLDKPVGCWSLQKDDSGSIAIIRNNIWKGYTAYHKCNTDESGSIYVGDGLKNENFCFMV
mmetsp:Transcript_3899/g.6621  ORF Transcript_3899/g.6621 Transcript_3899/m.6621 type:complete len:307 (-) Transcript_3899:24-944(-)